MKTAFRFLACAVLACVPAYSYGSESPYSSYVYYDLSSGSWLGARVANAEGIPLSGPRYNAELWGNGTDPSSLAPAFYYRAYELNREMVRVFAPFGTGSRAGYFLSDPNSGGLGVFRADSKNECWLQVRAWDTTLGATYEEVAARGIGGYGESPVFRAQGGVWGGLPELPYPLIGLQSFQLRPIVPEPGTAVLLVFGLAGLGWVYRNRERN